MPTNSELTPRDLEGLLKIDEHALDEALLIQPDSFYRVAKALALAISRRDEAKVLLADEEASVDLKARRDAEIAGDKITEAEVKQRVRLDKAVGRARGVFMNCEKQVNKWLALKESFIQRSHALKHLVELYIANYYSDATNQKARGNEREATAQRARVAMNEARRNSRSR